MRHSLRLHPVPLAAGVAVALLTLQLGDWQTRRAGEKEAMQARFRSADEQAPRALGKGEPSDWQRVVLRGSWLAGQGILLDNRVHRGRPGYHVVTPLRLEGDGGIVLVNRGWVPAGLDRAVLPVVPATAGLVTVEGRVRLPGEKPFLLAGDPAASPTPVRWQALDLERYRAVTGLLVRDFHVQQTNDTGDGLVRDWPAPDAGVERHRGYALQWYSLATLAALLTLYYVWNALRRILNDRRDAR